MPEWVSDLFPNVVVFNVLSALFLLLVRLACFHNSIGFSPGYLTFCIVFGLKPTRAVLFCFTSFPKPGKTNSRVFYGFCDSEISRPFSPGSS